MITKKITYEDYLGNVREEEFSFHLKKSDLMEMELSTTGGLEQKIRRIVAAQDTPEIIAVFKDIILKSYGKVSDDGRRFIKSEALSKEFSETEAYSELFMELSTDADAAAAFINGITPKIDTPTQPADVVALPDNIS